MLLNFTKTEELFAPTNSQKKLSAIVFNSTIQGLSMNNKWKIFRNLIMTNYSYLRYD